MSEIKKQNVSSDLSLQSFLKNVVSEVFNLDSRIIKTLSALFKRPGYLTSEYFEGYRNKYVQPLKLYFIINFIFFFITPILNTPQFQVFNFNLKSLTKNNGVNQEIIENEIKSGNVSEEIYEERFNIHLKYNQPAFLFLIIPFFALILKILNFKNRKYFVEHLIFSIHFLSFFLITLVVSVSLFRLSKFGLECFSVSSSIVGLIILAAFVISIIVYLAIAEKEFYKNKILASTIKSIFLFAGFVLTVMIYVQFLFFYTVLALMLGY